MNLRIVKKDIDFLTDEFLSDALISLGFAADDNAKREAVTGTINEAIDLRSETYSKINHTPKEGSIKAYYRATTETFLSSLDALYDKLSAINAKKE